MSTLRAEVTEALKGSVDTLLIDDVFALAHQAIRLEEVARTASTDPAAALALLRDIPDDFNLTFMRTAVIALAHKCINDLTSGAAEIEVRREFYANLSTYLPGAKQVRRETVPGHIPDGFVHWNGSIVPIEVKRGAFDAKALQQLQRYMSIYQCAYGIAVAPQLTCQMPKDVTYIKVSV